MWDGNILRIPSCRRLTKSSAGSVWQEVDGSGSCCDNARSIIHGWADPWCKKITAICIAVEVLGRFTSDYERRWLFLHTGLCGSGTAMQRRSMRMTFFPLAILIHEDHGDAAHIIIDWICIGQLEIAFIVIGGNGGFSGDQRNDLNVFRGHITAVDLVSKIGS